MSWNNGSDFPRVPPRPPRVRNFVPALVEILRDGPALKRLVCRYTYARDIRSDAEAWIHATREGVEARGWPARACTSDGLDRSSIMADTVSKYTPEPRGFPMENGCDGHRSRSVVQHDHSADGEPADILFTRISSPVLNSAAIVAFIELRRRRFPRGIPRRRDIPRSLFSPSKPTYECSPAFQDLAYREDRGETDINPSRCFLIFPVGESLSDRTGIFDSRFRGRIHIGSRNVLRILVFARCLDFYWIFHCYLS